MSPPDLTRTFFHRQFGWCLQADMLHILCICSCFMCIFGPSEIISMKLPCNGTKSLVRHDKATTCGLSVYFRSFIGKFKLAKFNLGPSRTTQLPSSHARLLWRYRDDVVAYWHTACVAGVGRVGWRRSRRRKRCGMIGPASQRRPWWEVTLLAQIFKYPPVVWVHP